MREEFIASRRNPLLQHTKKLLAEAPQWVP